ncbi:MAG: hypothetical protein ACRD3Q_18770, partial [Terriglobales bacterium]
FTTQASNAHLVGASASQRGAILGIQEPSQKAAATGSTSSGAIQPATAPANPKIEASGFSSDLDAATAAGNAYGPEGTANDQEVELGLLQIHAGDWGYLTPGWGPVGATEVNFRPVLDAYTNAGFSLTGMEWMHGHFDNVFGFSATDFGLVYGRSAPYRTFLINAHGETRWMGYGDLLRYRGELTPEQAIRGLQGYQELLPNGLPGH